jgi:hypothetical protein
MFFTPDQRVSKILHSATYNSAVETAFKKSLGQMKRFWALQMNWHPWFSLITPFVDRQIGKKFSPALKKKFPHRHQKVLRKDEARYSFIGFRFQKTFI